MRSRPPIPAPLENWGLCLASVDALCSLHCMSNMAGSTCRVASSFKIWDGRERVVIASSRGYTGVGELVQEWLLICRYSCTKSDMWTLCVTPWVQPRPPIPRPLEHGGLGLIGVEAIRFLHCMMSNMVDLPCHVPSSFKCCDGGDRVLRSRRVYGQNNSNTRPAPRWLLFLECSCSTCFGAFSEMWTLVLSLGLVHRTDPFENAGLELTSAEALCCLHCMSNGQFNLSL